MMNRIRDKLKYLFLIRFFNRELHFLLNKTKIITGGWKMDFLSGRIKTIYFKYLTAAFSGNAIWFAMPITELLVSVYVIHEMIKYTKQLSTERMIKK